MFFPLQLTTVWAQVEWVLCFVVVNYCFYMGEKISHQENDWAKRLVIRKMIGRKD